MIYAIVAVFSFSLGAVSFALFTYWQAARKELRPNKYGE